MNNRKIGVMASINLDSVLTHDLFSKILDQFKSYCEQNGFKLTFINSASQFLAKHSVVDQVKEQDLKGLLLITGNYDSPELIDVFGAGFPLVTIDCTRDGAVSIVSDNESGIRTLTEYIINEKKHRRLAYISGDADSVVAQARLKNFISTCESLGCPISREYICESRFRDIRLVARRTEELLNMEVPPTCIFFPDDFSAIGGINVIHNRGLDVPKDISYCGYDGVNLVGLFDPQICTIMQDTEAMGTAAAKEMIRMIDNNDTGHGEEIVIPTRIQYGHTVSQLH